MVHKKDTNHKIIILIGKLRGSSPRQEQSNQKPYKYEQHLSL